MNMSKKSPKKKIAKKKDKSMEKDAGSEKAGVNNSDMKTRKVRYDRVLMTGIVIVLIIAIAYGIYSLSNLLGADSPKDQGTLVASVNGEPIYSSEVNKLYEYLQAQMGPQVTKDYVLNQTINQKLLLQEAAREGINVDESKVVAGVDKWLEDLKTQVSEDQLNQILKSKNMTYDEFRNDTIDLYLKDFIIFTLLNKTVFADINQSQFQPKPVTEQDIQQYYQLNNQSFYQINVSHILVCYNGSMGCSSSRTKDEARTLIDDIYGKLQANGDFAELSMQYSDDPNAADSGTLGFISRGQTVKEFEDAAFALKYPNQLSKPIETGYGFHIIKLNSIKTGLDAFRSDIKSKLEQTQQQNAQAVLNQVQSVLLTQYIQSLRANADIRLYPAQPAEQINIMQTPGIQTFNLREGPVCAENGKPVIRLFSTTTCPHCNWIKGTFDQTVMPYVEQGKIVAYHWELDTGDNTLTSTVETYVPEDEKKIFSQFNPNNSIPTFVFGCKYYRVGNGYEAEKDLTSERREFTAVINELINEASNSTS